MGIRTVPQKSFSRRQSSRACRQVATGSGQGAGLTPFQFACNSPRSMLQKFRKAISHQQRTHVGEYVMRLDIDGFGKSLRHRRGEARLIILACR